MKQTIFAGILLVSIASLPVAATPIDPFAVYSFDASDTSDSSGNGNDGTVMGGVTFVDTIGWDGSVALMLDPVAGLSGINTGIDINRDVIPSLTMGAWVRPTSNGIGAGGKLLSHDNGGFDRTLGIDSRGSQPGFSYAAFTGAGVIDADAPDSTLLVWRHIAVVYDNATSALFVNGALVESFSDLSGINDSTFNLFIGTNPGFDEDFRGAVDDVFVYDRALTAGDIHSIYLNGFDNGPVASVPLPGGLPLMLGGLAMLVAAKRIRKRGQAQEFSIRHAMS